MNTGKRAVIMIGALAALLPFGATAPRAAVLDPTVAMVGTATPIDWAIDLAVQLRTQGGSLTSAEARIAREYRTVQVGADHVMGPGHGEDGGSGKEGQHGGAERSGLQAPRAAHGAPESVSQDPAG